MRILIESFYLATDVEEFLQDIVDEIKTGNADLTAIRIKLEKVIEDGCDDRGV